MPSDNWNFWVEMYFFNIVFFFVKEDLQKIIRFSWILKTQKIKIIHFIFWGGVRLSASLKVTSAYLRTQINFLVSMVMTDHNFGFGLYT